MGCVCVVFSLLFTFKTLSSFFFFSKFRFFGDSVGIVQAGICQYILALIYNQ